MKKIVTLIIAVCLCLTATLVGCDSTGFSNDLSDLNGDVSSNGGFAVVKGDYVYFINGVATYTDNNTYGKVKTGALVRIKKNALKDGEKKDNAELVIPSLFVAGDKNSGFYIFDDYVYYATPVNAKNKEGKIENTKLNFAKTSLDGKTTHSLKVVSDNSTQYRYVKNGDKVYLVLNTVNDKSEAVLSILDVTGDEPVNVIVDGGNKVESTEKIESMIFSSESDFDAVYYTKTAHDDNLDEDEKFNELHRITLTTGVDETLVSGKSLMGLDNQKTTDGFGTQGIKFSLVRDTKDILYLKGEYVDSSMTKIKEYYAVGKNDFNGFIEDRSKYIINNGTKNADSIFGENSLFVSPDCIIYLDNSLGIVAYNKKDLGADYITNKEGCTVISGRKCSEDIKESSYTAKFWDNGYLYMADSNNYYYRIKVLEGDEIVNKDDMKVEKVNFLANSTDWYLPEVIRVDGKDYFLSVYTAEPYNSLVYVSDIEANQGKTDEDIEKIRESKKENVEANLATCISLLSDEKKEARDNYIKDNFKDEEE